MGERLTKIWLDNYINKNYLLMFIVISVILSTITIISCSNELSNNEVLLKNVFEWDSIELNSTIPNNFISAPKQTRGRQYEPYPIDVFIDNFENDTYISYQENVKLDKDRNEFKLLKINRKYDGTDGKIVQQTNDGGYIVFGSVLQQGSYNDWNLVLIKTDDFGIVQWRRIYGGKNYDFGYCCQELEGGGYIMVGVTSSYSENLKDVWIIKTDQKGNI